MTDYRFEYIKNQMIDELLVEQQKTNDETIQTLKEDIAILQEKLQKLEELSQTKTPCEEAFKRVYGYFPTEPNWDDDEVRWESFQKGYNASKVSETPQEPEELKTLYQMFENEGAYGQIYFDDALKVVKSWMSQYADNVMTGE
jgi:predicted nuclease with TOPRIM domain